MKKALIHYTDGNRDLSFRIHCSRHTLWQIAGALVIALFLFASADILRKNLTKLGLSAGFDFIYRPAGFEIGESFIRYSPTDSIAYAILVGAVNTCVLVLAVGCISTVLGVILGLLRINRNPLIRGITSTFVEVMRNTPLLMQILLWSAIFLKLPPAAMAPSWAGVIFSQRGVYLPALTTVESHQAALWSIVAFSIVTGIFAAGTIRKVFLRLPGIPGAARNGWMLPIVLGIIFALVAGLITALTYGVLELSFPVRKGFNFSGGMSFSPEFSAMLVALSLYFSAFIAEIVRNGIQSVPRGQWEACRSLGMHESNIMMNIILPQTVRIICPAVIAQYISLIKNSSLAIAIGYPDLFWSIFTTINITGHAIEGVAILAGAYLILTLGISFIFNRWYILIRRKG